MKTSEIAKWVKEQRDKGLDTDEIIIAFEKLTKKTKKNGSSRNKKNR